MALNVKVGDKVIYVTNHYKKIATVTKVTPTGRIRVDCSPAQFTDNGREIGGDIWSSASLWEYDEQVAEQIKADGYIALAVNLMYRANPKDLSVEDAKEIIRILRKNKAGE